MLIIDDDFRIIAHDDLFLKGECKRCGKCCYEVKKDCEHLRFETLDGKRRAVCSIYMKRPIGCALYPMKDDKLPEGCGFHWEKM